MVEIVNKFTYLGVSFSSSGQGLTAAKNAVSKGKVAAAEIINIIKQLKASTWHSANKLYKSMVTSVVLYASPCWGLSYLDLVKTVQLYFFKRLFGLASNTQSSALRLELDILPLTYYIDKAALNWLVKISKMESNRLPKICFDRLLHLSNNDKIKFNQRLNWIDSPKLILAPLGCDYICHDLNAFSLSTWVPDCIERLSIYLRHLDERNYVDSSSCIFYFHSLLSAGD